MKKLLLLLVILLPFFVTAQRGAKKKRMSRMEKRNLKYYDEIFGTKDKDFSIVSAPEEWKDESAVLLCQKFHISFLRNTSTNYGQTKGVIRKRVLIQDKSALEIFSEFYFQESEASGINLIKKDGKVIRVDLTDAIKMETDIPDFYKDSYQSQDYYKIAIANLEVGDILDYFKVFTEDYQSANISLMSVLDESYPIVKQEIIFDVDKKWTLYQNSFNGAPKFIKDPKGGVDKSGRKRKMVKRYVLLDKMRKSKKSEMWSYLYVNDPMFKVMAAPSSSEFYDKKVAKKSKLDLNKALKITSGNNTLILNYYLKNVRQKLKRAKVNKLSDKEYVDYAYRALRYEFTYNSFRDLTVGLLNEKEGDLVYTPSHSLYDMNSRYFAVIFAKVLDKEGFDSDVIVGVPRYLGGIDDVVSVKELVYGLYVPGTKRFYWNITNYREPNYQLEELAGTDAYSVPFNKLKRHKYKIEKVKIPFLGADMNVSETKMEIIVEADNVLKIKSKNFFSGSFKNRYNEMLLFHTKYIYEDSELFLSNIELRELDKWDDLNNSKIKRVKKRDQKNLDEQAEYKEKKDRIIERYIQSDFKDAKDIEFKLISFGVNSTEEKLGIEVDFTLSGLIQKAGPNLIFEVGRLITSQVHLDEKDKKIRERPMDISSTRKIINEFSIVLPEGLVAKGLDKLVMDIDNKNGKFLTSAVQNGNILNIRTEKVYKNNHVPTEEWNDMIEMLNAAYTFSQLKIILKKQ